MTIKWWGAIPASMGWACLPYEWVYLPLCSKVFNVEPWGITVYGAVLIGTGIVANLVQLSVGEQPSSDSK